MYLQATENHFACDIEADNLLDKATTIYCVCVINLVTKKKETFTDAEAFRNFLDENPDYILVGHNFASYDTVMLNRFWGARIPITRIVDTFVLSQLYNPTYAPPKGCRKGGHSLEAWGIRLRYPKTEFDDFSGLSDEMLKYCMNDTILAGLLFIRLTERMRQVGFTEQGAEIEHLAWNIIQNKQKRNGFPFDIQRAQELYVTLRAREEELKNEIYKLWPPRLEVVASYRKPFKKSGEPSSQYLRHCEQYPEVRTGADGYDVLDYVAFNLGSPSQRIEKLLELGWKPVNFTKKTAKGGGGNPKVDEDSLLEFAEASGKSELKALSKWIVINSRANMINTWMEAYNDKTGAIHGSLFIASTLRYRHSGPNSANIPAVRLVKDPEGVDQIQYGEAGGYSYEARDLWTCGDPNKWSLVGEDGTGIQNRCLIHNLIKVVGEDRVAPFKELSLYGDIHKRNIEVLGLANKAAAKKAYYTIMMGGGGGRIAADQAQFGTKLTAKEGEALRKGIVDGIPGFQELIEALQAELEEKGRIKLCDGTPILVPSPHMVIPYILQGDESRVMKKALILIDQEIRRRKFTEHAIKVCDIHDEHQWKVRVGYEEEFIAFSLPCFAQAGLFFDYNIPISGDAKIGKTWSQTH